MTFKEFNKKIVEINQEEFQGQSFHPFDYGIERALFEERRLQKLIQVAAKARFQTAKVKKETWTRQLKRAQESKARLEKMKLESLVPVKTAALERNGSARSISPH